MPGGVTIGWMLLAAAWAGEAQQGDGAASGTAQAPPAEPAAEESPVAPTSGEGDQAAAKPAPSTGAEAPVEPECADFDLPVVVDQLVTAITDDELAYAEREARRAIRSLPCLSRVADPEDLASLWQVLGAAAIYGGRPEEARGALLQSQVVHPGWFNHRLGPEVRAAWEQAGAVLPGEATIQAWPIPDQALLYVDGTGREEQPVTVLAGTHLVQVAVGADVHLGQLLAVAPGEELLVETGLPEPSGFRLRDAPWLVAAAGGLLGGAAAATGAWYLDSRLDGATDLTTLRALYWGSVGLQAATAALGGVSVTGVVLHFRGRHLPAE